MKPCAERQMRGLSAVLATRHSCPHPAQSHCLAQLSAQPTKDRCPELGAPGPLPAPPSPCWHKRRGQKDVLEAGSCAPCPGDPRASRWVPSPLVSRSGWVCSHPRLPGGVCGPLCSFTRAAWRSNTIYGAGVDTAVERVGESPCPALGRGERPLPPGAPTQCCGGAGGVQRPARLLPSNLFPLRLPPPSPPPLLQEEIQQLKSKLEKVEKERNELRLNSDRLESRVGPCWHREGLRCCTIPPWRLPRPTVLLPPLHPRSQS